MGDLLRKFRDVARASPLEMSVLAVLGLAVIGGGAYVMAKTKSPPPPPISVAAPAASPSAAELVVHVAGAVVSPGVYTLPAGSRVHEAIEAAGGAAAGAVLDALNLAAPVADGERIYVPNSSEGGGGPSSEGPGGPPSKLDLNTATAAQLEQLPGVGPVLAQRIVEHRQRKRFTSVRQLLEVEGFGPKKYESLKDLVKV